jgi:hypothetical protein
MLPLELNVDGQPFLSGRTPKTYVRGTHRTIPPAETLARLKPLLPEIGITRLANVTGLDTIGIPVVMSVRPCSRSLSVSQGKGLDLDSAKVSAAMESIEGYHAKRVTGPLRLASYDGLRQTHVVVDPLRLPLSLVRPFRPPFRCCGSRATIGSAMNECGYHFSSFIRPTPRGCGGTSSALPYRVPASRLATTCSKL